MGEVIPFRERGGDGKDWPLPNGVALEVLCREYMVLDVNAYSCPQTGLVLVLAAALMDIDGRQVVAVYQRDPGICGNNLWFCEIFYDAPELCSKDEVGEIFLRHIEHLFGIEAIPEI